jgi:hypothetical protein
MWRIFENALVQRVPSREELQALNQRFPSAEIQLHIDQGMRLSDLKDQDSYSYEVAVIFLAANNQHKLLQKYRDVQHAIPIELEAVD